MEQLQSHQKAFFHKVLLLDNFRQTNLFLLFHYLLLNIIFENNVHFQVLLVFYLKKKDYINIRAKREVKSSTVLTSFEQ